MRRRESVTTSPPPELASIDDPVLARILRDVYDHLFVESEATTVEQTINQTSTTGGHEFTDRGDPASVDWDEGDLTRDGAWHDLDLSGVVPSDCVLVLLRVTLDNAGGADNQIMFREDGNSNALNVAKLTRHDHAGHDVSGDLLVRVASQTIEYNVTSLQTTVDIVVGGWWA